jgi:hypothetical protein
VRILQAYVSGNAVVILKGPQDIVQTIYIDDVESLEAITIEETSGTIAVCGGKNVYIYKPFGREVDVLKVRGFLQDDNRLLKLTKVESGHRCTY